MDNSDTLKLKKTLRALKNQKSTQRTFRNQRETKRKPKNQKAPQRKPQMEPKEPKEKPSLKFELAGKEVEVPPMSLFKNSQSWPKKKN